MASAGKTTKYEPTKEVRDRVEKLSAYGLKFDEIRSVVVNPATGNPISASTFSALFARELATGRITVGEKIRNNILRIASTSSGPQAIAAAKLYFNFVERITGADSESKVSVTVSNENEANSMTSDDRKRNISALLAAAIAKRKVFENEDFVDEMIENGTPIPAQNDDEEETLTEVFTPPDLQNPEYIDVEARQVEQPQAPREIDGYTAPSD